LRERFPKNSTGLARRFAGKVRRLEARSGRIAPSPTSFNADPCIENGLLGAGVAFGPQPNTWGIAPPAHHRIRRKMQGSLSAFLPQLQKRLRHFCDKTCRRRVETVRKRHEPKQSADADVSKINTSIVGQVDRRTRAARRWFPALV